MRRASPSSSASRPHAPPRAGSGGGSSSVATVAGQLTNALASTSTLSASAPSGRELPRSGSSRPAAVATTTSSRLRKSEHDKVRIVGDHYQLGAEIGRGGFGVVYAALDLRNGRSVAIKQVSLHDIDKDELLSIESEISLLRKLNHENIVKYHDTIRTQSSLYIVLEYMENGSLAQFMKRFGALSETLVAMYITQVLRGLAYLHEQGVLHRDVKGANILTTKDGLVKLADFGVAVKLSETQKSNSVVGSPYWMAPEVIEMAGWSFASDVWSVGCTIIELLSTKPPYFDLAPMAALFRIVQDDHPPLPERISPALHDFIMKCFMKEPRLRSSAEELLTHPWIAQIPKNKVEQSSQLVVEHVSSRHDRDAMLNTIKLYEKEKHTSVSESSALSPDLATVPDDGDDDDDDENWDDELGLDAAAPTPLALPGASLPAPKQPSVAAGAATSKPTVSSSDDAMLQPLVLRTNVFQLSKEDEQALFDEDVWDDDADEPVSAHTVSTSAPPRVSYMDSSRTGQRSSGAGQAAVPSSLLASSSSVSTSSWDRSTLVPTEKRLTKLLSFSEKGHEDASGWDEFDEDQLLQALARTSSASGGRRSSGRTGTLDAFADDDDVDDDGDDAGFDDLLDSSKSLALRLSRRNVTTAANNDAAEAFADFEDELGFDSLRDSNQKATARVVDLLALLDPSMDDQVILDACRSLQEIFESNPTLRRDLMSQPGVVPNIMEALEMKKMDVLHAVLRVVNLITHVLTTNRMLTQIVADNQRFQENLALVGLVPVVIKLTKQDVAVSMPLNDELRFASLVRLEAARFVRQSCQTSALTLQMFIACGGLPVLVDFLTPSTPDPALALARPAAGADKRMGSDNADLALLRIALEGIASVFELQTIPKNDICRLFVKAGLLRKFVGVFNAIVASVSALPLPPSASSSDITNGGTQRWTMAELHTTCDIFLIFSQGDAVVKDHMCDAAVLDGLLRALQPQRNDSPAARAADDFVAAMVKVLKCVRNLSMEPMTLEKLDRAGAIPTLVHVLNAHANASASATTRAAASTSRSSSNRSAKRNEVEGIVLHAMFYLCRINRNRQTHAAQAGVIPSLLKVTRDASPFKQLALPILCDLAHASPTARAHLWACDCGPLFLDLLADKYSQLEAFKALSVWLVHDTVKMEHVLLQPPNVLKLIACFRTALDAAFENLLEPLLDMLHRSVRMNQTLGRSALFVTELLARLRRVPKAIVRKNLLKMLKSLFESHTAPTQFVVEYNLRPTLAALAQDENSMILVKEIASQLLQAILVAAAVF